MIKKHVTTQEIVTQVEKIEYITTDGRTFNYELDATQHQNFLDLVAEQERISTSVEKLDCYGDYFYLVKNDADLENVRGYEYGDTVEDKRSYPNFTTFYTSDYGKFAIQLNKADLLKMLEMLN